MNLFVLRIMSKVPIFPEGKNYSFFPSNYPFSQEYTKSCILYALNHQMALFGIDEVLYCLAERKISYLNS